MHNNIDIKPHEQEYINSLSQAVLQKTPMKFRIILYLWILVTALFLIWANLANIDELVRGTGEIVPSGDNQIVQNLEGGIVQKILIHENEEVKKGQVLVKIDNSKSTSKYDTSKLMAQDLQAQIFRLQAEATGHDLVVDKNFIQKYPQSYKREKKLFLINLDHMHSEIKILDAQKRQIQSQSTASRIKIKDLKRSLYLIKQEVIINKPMVKQGLKSKIDFLKLQREQNSIKERYNSEKELLPKYYSALNEIKEKKLEVQKRYMSKAQEKLNEQSSKLSRVQSSATALKDEVSRTSIVSPVNGHVQKLFVHTVGGVIKPGEDIVEIVPSDATLWVEAKIKPSDIAFIYPTQKAIIKVTAYNFAIFGALKGKVVSISSDTVQNKKGDKYYIVRIKTKRSETSNNRKIVLMPGMTVHADIVTGKRTVMDYILKPILKTKQYMFTEM